MAMKVDQRVWEKKYTGSELTIIMPDDWHLHLRDGRYMASVVKYSAERSGRAIIMPNLRPPITTVNDAREYRKRILLALPEDSQFEPLMTLYLTDNTDPDEINRAVESDFVKSVKLYPAGATTNSDAGVTDIKKVYAVGADTETRYGAECARRSCRPHNRYLRP